MSEFTSPTERLRAGEIIWDTLEHSLGEPLGEIDGERTLPAGPDPAAEIWLRCKEGVLEHLVIPLHGRHGEGPQIINVDRVGQFYDIRHTKISPGYSDLSEANVNVTTTKLNGGVSSAQLVRAALQAAVSAGNQERFAYPTGKHRTTEVTPHGETLKERRDRLWAKVRRAGWIGIELLAAAGNPYYMTLPPQLNEEME